MTIETMPRIEEEEI